MLQPARFPNPRIAAFGDLQRRLATLNRDVVVNDVIRKGAADRVAKAQALVLAAQQKAKPQRLVLQRKAAQDIAKTMKARLQNAAKSVTHPSPEALLQGLAGRLSTHDALGRRASDMIRVGDLSKPDAARATTFIIDTGRTSSRDDVANAIARALAPWSSGRRAADWLRVEPLYRKRKTDRLFCADLAIPRADAFAARFKLAALIRRAGGFASVQFERSDSLRFACTWHRTSPAPVDTEWNLRLMRVIDAWALTPPQGGRTQGEGVWIGHPDTGWNENPEYDHDQIDRARQHNTFFNTSGEDVAKHPTYPQMGPVLNTLTHGSGTGSVMISHKATRIAVNPVPTGPGPDHPVPDGVQISGVAPLAKVIPVRCVDGVILLPDNRNLGRAIEYLMDLGDPQPAVISISLGGAPHYTLQDIIREAVRDKHIIVVAAAGQYAVTSTDNTTVEPASYPGVVAAGGCTDIGHPWDLALSGPAVAVSAPATGVDRADYKNGATVQPVVVWGDGTSFAAAQVASIAALWVAFWGRQQLLDKYRPAKVPLGHVFRQLAMQTANPQRIVDNTTPLLPCSEPWPRDRYGAGIIDARALLQAALPEPGDVMEPPKQQQNLITGIPEVNEWFDDLIGDLEKLGSDAVREGRELIGEIGRQGDMWIRAGERLAAQTTRQAERAALDLWTNAEALAGGAVGAAQGAARTIADQARALWDDVSQAAEDAADAAADGATQFADACEQGVKDLANSAEDAGDAVVGWVSSWFD